MHLSSWGTVRARQGMNRVKWELEVGLQAVRIIGNVTKKPVLQKVRPVAVAVRSDQKECVVLLEKNCGW
jgi:ATP-dependent RNA circularization protein (DNA/RNA ligase family)